MYKFIYKIKGTHLQCGKLGSNIDNTLKPNYCQIIFSYDSEALV